LRIVIDNYVPKPKQRPRFNKYGGVYSPSGSEEQILAWEIISYISHNYPKRKTITDNIKVSLIISARQELKGDIDNYVKFVYDAIQKSGIIENDKQIRESHTRIRKGNNQIIITISEYEEMTREEKRVLAKQMRREGVTIKKIMERLNVSYRFARG
jgi:Holliday junction resolvase RusA-like endonuclease